MDCFHGNSFRLCIFCFRELSNSKQAWPECHIINYLPVLTKLTRVVLGNIGPRSFLYGLRCAQSVLPQLQANISQYGPRVQLVRGYYAPINVKLLGGGGGGAGHRQGI